MGDLLQTAASWLGGLRAEHMARTVTYARGSQSVSVAATPGKTTFEVSDQYGGVERWESRDFLIAVAALVLAGVVVQPQRGDRITDGGKVYEVLAPGTDDVYRTDNHGVTLRIHTKQVQ